MDVSVSNTRTTDTRVNTAKSRERIGSGPEASFEASSDHEGRPQEDRVNLAEDITDEMFGRARGQKSNAEDHR